MSLGFSSFLQIVSPLILQRITHYFQHSKVNVQIRKKAVTSHTAICIDATRMSPKHA